MLIKPATNTRIDLGLKLNNIAFNGRLLASGPFGTMCSHRVQIFNQNEIDPQLKSWIDFAYQQSV